MLSGIHQAFAQQVVSPGYSSNEYFFGSGADYNLSSPGYQGYGSAGGLGVGDTSSSSYNALGGFLTRNVPFLEVFVNTGTIDMGVLSSAATATGTATFRVKLYQGSGYVVRTMGNPPSIPGHSLANLSSPTLSAAGTEQFGMNLVHNTLPTTFGSDPAQIPNPSTIPATFGFGFTTNGYQNANQYKYNTGDTVAQSNSASGETDYTVAYIMNITTLTPAGTYTYNQDLVVTGTY